MTDDTPPAGLAASAGSGPPATVDYETVPPQIVCERTPVGLRISVPVTGAVRRAYVWYNVAPMIWGIPIFIGLTQLEYLHDHGWSAPPAVWTLVELLVLTLVTAAHWASARHGSNSLRPSVIELTADQLFKATPGRRPWSLKRGQIRHVRVKRWRPSRFGTLVVTTSWLSRPIIPFGTIDDLDPVAAELRAALGPPSAPPPTPSAALLR